MSNDLPRMTHLQFAICNCIPPEGIWAPVLMPLLSIEGPRFYQAMGRMEKRGWIETEQKVIYGKRTGTFIRVTELGRDEAKESVRFYG